MTKHTARNFKELLEKTAAGKECKHCEEFFARFRCGANVGEGECDCPKCQGYCECPDYWTQQNPPEDT